MILVIVEQKDGKLNRATWEAIAAAQQLAESGQLSIAVLGASVGAVAGELSTAQATEIIVVEAAALEPYTSDGFTAALAHVVAS